MSSSPNQFTKDFVRKLAHIAKKNLKIKDGDYQKNEIWYCGKCNMPMQIKSGDELLCIPCHCVINQIKKHKEKMHSYDYEITKENLVKNAFYDINFKYVTFDKIPENYRNDEIVEYVQNFDKNTSKGLLINGSIRSGKTTLALCITNALLNRGFKCKYTNALRLHNDFIISRNQLLDDIRQFDLIIIDDFLDSHDLSNKFLISNMYQIINSRFESNQPMIIVTSLPNVQMHSTNDLLIAKIFSKILLTCKELIFSRER